MAGCKWQPKLNHFERQALRACPKAVLFIIARQFAAQISGDVDDLRQGGAVTDLILQEWESQFNNGNVPQRPPKIVRASNF